MYMLFVAQLPKAKKYAVYKATKKYLADFGVFSYEYIKEAMSEKVRDLPYEVQRNSGLL